MSLPNSPCQCCGKDRADAGKKPRTLKVLPTWTAGNNKRRRKYPVFVCEFCDGPVYGNAMARKAA